MRRLRVPLSYATDEVDLQGARERWFQNGRRAWAWAGESWRAARESRAGEQSGRAERESRAGEQSGRAERESRAGEQSGRAERESRAG
jgi:hypothetical protein